jgi:hypothetical protein
MRLYQWHETYHVGQLGILRSLAVMAENNPA